jgi:RimJ/RimL family protein N-acetyltransferase
VNTEAKWLLLNRAFNDYGTARVDLKTDARNERSRNAIARIGATFEGILHQWQESQVAGEEALYRDTAMYAITSEQWPSVRRALEAKLSS